MNADMLTGFRDELVREAGVVTPGVDDTPYIQFAIEALTRDRDTGYSGNDSLSSDGTLPASRAVPDQGLGYYQPTAAGLPQRQLYGENRAYLPQDRIPDSMNKITPYTEFDALRLDGQQTSQDHDFPPPAQGVLWNNGSIPVEKGGVQTTRPDEAEPTERDRIRDPASETNTTGFPPLQYRPWLLCPASFITLLLLCALMVAGLIFCAIYSATSNGFVAYAYRGPSYGGQYFLFRILPQLLASIILVYTQCVVSTIFRILPFVRLASQNRAERESSIYMDLYPRSRLWPQLMDKWEMWMFVFVAWLINLTLPLQSSLFTVISVDGTWRWATVQGVVWTLVALYIVLMVSSIITLIEWTKITQTGLLWDPRSLADIIVMVSDTNVAGQYKGTELASHRSTIGFALRHRNVERLGLWPRRDGRGGTTTPYYAIRSNEADNPRNYEYTHEKAAALKATHDGAADYVYDTARDRDLEAAHYQHEGRHRHLPWCMRNNQLLFSVVTATILLVALFVVSFLRSTRLSAGFLPGVPSHPGPGAFSAANFLYSFVPSLIGLLLYLLFQSLDQSFRVLQPWAAMANSAGTGATAGKSILADYAACPLPAQAALRAVRNGHYRVAALSLLSTLFVFLPVLGGGLFMALTDVPTGAVRIFPSVPVYAVILALLVLYLAALISVLPYRHDFRLPHGVTCLAEVVGLLVNEDLRAERCFKSVRTRQELLGKMGVGRGDDRWIFGEGEVGSTLGVRRVRKFTEKRKVRKSQIRRGGRYGVSGRGA
jgi:hypothetical protein